MMHTEATKKKLSEMRKGKKNPFYGRKHTEETKKKLSEMNRLRGYDLKRQFKLNSMKIKIPTGDTLAYLAGVIDSDGSMRFIKKTIPFIAIYNSYKKLMDWIIKTVGGSISRDYRGREIQYSWRICAARDVYKLTKAVLPYLIVKRDDAKNIIHFLEGKYGGKLWE